MQLFQWYWEDTSTLQKNNILQHLRLPEGRLSQVPDVVESGRSNNIFESCLLTNKSHPCVKHFQMVCCIDSVKAADSGYPPESELKFSKTFPHLIHLTAEWREICVCTVHLLELELNLSSTDCLIMKLTTMPP